ncbi:MAG: TIGR03663 family protein, partial [Thermoanaerobaculum sp.]|nr:TIGR03663 family protein [Thermoanaerobaculum sp.]MDW7967430.1 TIGR03663 family protein [Thermoanaerobaculum sp.]
MTKKERLAWLLLGLAALVTRFAVLGDRVPHHDEAVHAHIARELLLLAKYRYDPTYHGPLQFYVMAPLLALFGQNDFVARLWAATCGVGWVLAPLLLRRRIGAAAALATSLLILLSPTLTYYARFAREDTPVGFFTFTAAALLLAGQRSRHYALVPVGVLLALHLASKETFYVYLAVVGPALLATLWVGGRDVRRRLWSWVVSQRLKLLAGMLVFFALSLTLYTVFFRYPEDVLFPVKAFTYWWGQHQMERVAGPPWYYLPRLTLYEFLTLGLAAAFFLRRRWHCNPTWLFFLFWGLFSLAMYAYLGEKVPWLAVHQILPWLIPAGAVLGRVLARGGSLGQRLVVGLAVVATLWQNYHAVYANPAIEPATGKAELLVYVQTVPSLRQVIEEGKAL